MEQLWSRADATNRNGWQRERPRKRLNHLRTVVNDHFKPKSNTSGPANSGRSRSRTVGSQPGAVMAVPGFGEKDTRGFVAGLMDWIGARPPDAAALAGRTVVAQGKTRLEAITNTGGAVLGHRALELEGLAGVDPMDMTVGAVHTVWGRRTILNHAEGLESR